MTSPNWETPVDQCDVDNKARLNAFRERADVWIHALDQDDENSVTRQIITMMGEDAKWRSLNEARRLAMDRDDAATSGIVASLLDRGYVAGQVIAISRLIEQGNSRSPAKQVNSLKRLVDEIFANKGLLTREVFVARDGLPYSYEKMRAKHPLPVVEDAPVAMSLDEGQNQWMMAQMQHEAFDRLSGTTALNRTRDDVIGDAVFDRMNSTLADPVFADILALRHKSIAHAADKFSRAQATNLRKGMALDDFARAHYLLIGIYQVIAVGLLYQSRLGSPIATPQHDMFEHLDKPMVASEDMGKLHEFWQTHTHEREDWMGNAYEEIVSR